MCLGVFRAQSGFPRASSKALEAGRVGSRLGLGWIVHLRANLVSLCVPRNLEELPITWLLPILGIFSKDLIRLCRWGPGLISRQHLAGRILESKVR